MCSVVGSLGGGCISEICFSICLAKIIDSSNSFVLKLE